MNRPNRKIVLSFLILIFVSANSFSQGMQQLVPAKHWIYDALSMLYSETASTSLTANAPLSIAELTMYFSEISYERLSSSGKELYRQVADFFDNRKDLFLSDSVYTGLNIAVSPGVLYKSNDQIKWSFGTDYTGNGENSTISTKLKESFAAAAASTSSDSISYDTGIDYGAASSFSGNELTTPFIAIPIYLGFSDYVFLETIPFFGKSFWGMTSARNFTNIPYTADDFEFLWPQIAYGSIGKSFGNWGINLNIAKEGLQIGKTQTGSIIYNSTFETDCYTQLNIYSPKIKYNLDAIQISRNKFMYLHNLEIRPIKWFKGGMVEGTLINAPFELRFLNPLMIMHSFGAWDEYMSAEEKTYYGEAHVCAYIGFYADVTPCKYLRIYGLYAQNEIQIPAERKSETGRAMPDSLGGQLGFELTIPGNDNGWWLGTLEGIYTTPFLYIKHGAEWSLYRERYNMQSNGKLPICSWIGTPFGPDCVGLQARIGYSVPQKWNAEINYLFVAHGTNSFGLLDNTVTIDGKTYYAYYPSVLYKLNQEGKGGLTAQEAEQLAQSYQLTGIIQYTNQIVLKSSYSIDDHLTLNGHAAYTFIFNNKNQQGIFEQGFELSLALTYSVF
ncbi:hypothetical protein [Treponema brennaborense]|uniref:Capsule assembly Wzi family protein n=1 Tax=Treponema brennaborense (strain DSM 12168 / CIP 105900 / DD5/3) TaxID=906968 RepID=F4LMI6_TREBD|nr:hypothetical protein [Treponema brennaborense]AEE15748.1 hypothetical protein Trebr_0300 [Treponema brennaborense DSM 12168]